MSTEPIRPWQSAYRYYTPSAADLAGERVAAAEVAVALAAAWQGILAPTLGWFREVDWRQGYDLVKDGRIRGLFREDAPSSIWLDIGCTPADIFHTSAHETSHVAQFLAGGSAALKAADADNDAEADAAHLCKLAGNSCGRCGLAANPPLDFKTMRAKLRQPPRDPAGTQSRTVTRAPARPSTTAGVRPAPVVAVLGHITHPAALRRRMEEAALSGWDVDVGAGPETPARARARLDQWLRKADSQPAKGGGGPRFSGYGHEVPKRPPLISCAYRLRGSE